VSSCLCVYTIFTQNLSRNWEYIMMNSYYYQGGVSLPINAPIASSFEEVIKGKLNRDKLVARIEQSQLILRANRLLNLTYNHRDCRYES